MIAISLGEHGTYDCQWLMALPSASTWPTLCAGSKAINRWMSPSQRLLCVLWLDDRHSCFVWVVQVLESVGKGGLMRVAIILSSCLPTSSLPILPTGGGLSLLTGTPFSVPPVLTCCH